VSAMFFNDVGYTHRPALYTILSSNVKTEKRYNFLLVKAERPIKVNNFAAPLEYTPPAPVIVKKFSEEPNKFCQQRHCSLRGICKAFPFLSEELKWGPDGRRSAEFDGHKSVGPALPCHCDQLISCI